MATSALQRKQFLVSNQQIEKINAIRSIEGKSAAEVVRDAIDAYNPNNKQISVTPEMITLLSEEVNSAIAATRVSNDRIETLLNTLS